MLVGVCVVLEWSQLCLLLSEQSRKFCIGFRLFVWFAQVHVLQISGNAYWISWMHVNISLPKQVSREIATYAAYTFPLSFDTFVECEVHRIRGNIPVLMPFASNCVDLHCQSNQVPFDWMQTKNAVRMKITTQKGNAHETSISDAIIFHKQRIWFTFKFALHVLVQLMR